MKKLFGFFILTIVAISGLMFSAPVSAQAEKLPVYFFWGDGCPHCAAEKPFLEQLKQDYDIEVIDFEIYKNRDNLNLMKKVGAEMNFDISGVPLTIIGDKAFSGFREELTGAMIEQQIEYCLANDCPDQTGQVISSSAEVKPKEQSEPKNVSAGQMISVPFFGELDLGNFSLPVLTIILGGLDGFNPCAMWVLIFLITLLLGMKDRKRMWILGSAFIIASAAVYFLFMSAWLNLILFLGFIIWVRAGIGLVAIAGGVYNLKEFFTNKDAVCKVTNTTKRQLIFAKLKQAVLQNSFWLALGGIILLAFAVNLVELICSAGLPAVYTQILALSDLATWQYYAYILLYIFFFMLDDLIVFFIAMKTLQITGVTSKYTHASHLIGGVLMIILGLLLIFKPEWLMFG
jgi:thiol-disulfide isomerase/thioredoxin